MVWFLCVLFLWALRPLNDAIPVGINAKGVWTSQTVQCNNLFHSEARDNSPLPVVAKPLVYTREACTLVHTQARQVFIFDAFVTTKPEGTGLGLPIARTILQSYGGDLRAENRTRGAVFSFRLPLDRSATA